MSSGRQRVGFRAAMTYVARKYGYEMGSDSMFTFGTTPLLVEGFWRWIRGVPDDQDPTASSN